MSSSCEVGASWAASPSEESITMLGAKGFARAGPVAAEGTAAAADDEEAGGGDARELITAEAAAAAAVRAGELKCATACDADVRGVPFASVAAGEEAAPAPPLLAAAAATAATAPGARRGAGSSYAFVLPGEHTTQ